MAVRYTSPSLPIFPHLPSRRLPMEGIARPGPEKRHDMDALRVVARECVSPLDPCCRCCAEGCQWDRLGGLPICPDCQEALAQGHADALSLRPERRPCVLC